MVVGEVRDCGYVYECFYGDGGINLYRLYMYRNDYIRKRNSFLFLLGFRYFKGIYF